MTDEKPRKLSLKRSGDSTAPEAPRLEERLHKVLAQAGLGSRRALEQRIADGLVKVNGETAQVGMSIKGGDKIELDGRSFVASALTEPSRVLMYNKPEGEVTTREDPEGRPTIFDSLPALKGARWIAIGRLDINTTGLLLLTTDGELANALMHPSFEVDREYVCRVRAPEGQETVPDNLVDRLARGVSLDDGPAKFDEIERIGGSDSHDWFRVVVKEGRNREVRRLWESQGCQVSRLKRIRYGTVALPRELLRGHSQELVNDKVDALRANLGLEDGTPSALTLQPVIGQRKAAKSTVHLSGNERSAGYVGGHNTADEGRELRRFDHVREDRNGRGRGGPRKPGGLTVSGEAAARQSQKPFKQRKDKGANSLRSAPGTCPKASRPARAAIAIPMAAPRSPTPASPAAARVAARPVPARAPVAVVRKAAASAAIATATPPAAATAPTANAAAAAVRARDKARVRVSAARAPTATRVTRRASRPITPIRALPRMAANGPRATTTARVRPAANRAVLTFSSFTKKRPPEDYGKEDQTTVAAFLPWRGSLVLHP